MPGWWIFLFTLRVAWTLIGQTGYIHPDEFFQSSEVIAGDILEVESFRPWEFNSTSPLRSVVLPYLTCGFPYIFLRFLQHGLGIQAVTPHMVFISPRFVTTILSGFSDILIFKIAGKDGLLLFSTSYLAMVFYTRTLSNTFESLLFVSLLYFVTADKKAQETKFGQKAMRALTREGMLLEKRQRTRKSKSQKQWVAPKMDMSQDTACEVETLFSDVVWISFILVAGTFNRPTFLLFAFVPYVSWVFSACGSPYHHIATHTMDRISFTIVFSGFIAIIFIVVDSIYYGTLSPLDLLGIHKKVSSSAQIKELFSSMTVAPLNFILYNIKPSNLAEHGIHPRFQHLLVNTPSMFGILALFPIYNLGKVLETKLGIGKPSRWGNLTNTDKFQLMCYFVPLIMLSVFPHQEPRFLIPLLAPFSIIYGKKVFGWTAWKVWMYMWIIFNIFALILFGILHQGGIIPCINFMQSNLISSTKTHFNFFHTYMPPRHLFLIPKQATQNRNETVIHDLKGAPIDDLIKHIEFINKQHNKSSGITVQFVTVPSSLDKLFCEQYGNVSFKMIKHFPRHLSMEDPPTLFNDLFCKSDISCNRKCLGVSMLERIEKSLSLFLYKVIVK